MKKIVLLMLFAYAVCFWLGACSRKADTADTNVTDIAMTTQCSEDKTEIPEDIQAFYMDYLEAAKKDWKTAVDRYCHYEDEEKKLLAYDGLPLVDCEIIAWRKLSDQLWEVETGVREAGRPNMIYGFNYIGIIEGRFYVMPNYYQIPAFLKDGVALEYKPPYGPSVVDPEDIVGSFTIP